MVEIKYEKKLARAIINRAVKDVVSDNPRDARLALLFLRSSEFDMQSAKAGYPKALIECVKGIPALSPVQQKYMVGEVLGFLAGPEEPASETGETLTILRSSYEELQKSREQLKFELIKARKRIAEMEQKYESL